MFVKFIDVNGEEFYINPFQIKFISKSVAPYEKSTILHFDSSSEYYSVISIDKPIEEVLALLSNDPIAKILYTSTEK